MSQTTLVEDYLDGNDGSSQMYRRYLTGGQRIGQAFFNSLNERDQERLRGTLRDPFHKNDTTSVENAIEFLLYN